MCIRDRYEVDSFKITSLDLHRISVRHEIGRNFGLILMKHGRIVVTMNVKGKRFESHTILTIYETERPVGHWFCWNWTVREKVPSPSFWWNSARLSIRWQDNITYLKPIHPRGTEFPVFLIGKDLTTDCRNSKTFVRVPDTNTSSENFWANRPITLYKKKKNSSPSF